MRQNVLVDNRPSANGVIAGEIVARAAADGSVIAVGNTGTHAINATLYKRLSYDPVRDFAPIVNVMMSGLVKRALAALREGWLNLRWYGGELARFLARASLWRRQPLLAELARFEWALGLAFDAADASPVTAQAVAHVPAADWPAMRLRLHPSAQLLSLRSNAPRVWRTASAGRKSPAAEIRRRPAGWLVWRKGHEPLYRVLPPEEAWALGAAAKGRCFAALCKGLRRHVGEAHAARRAAQLLKGWLSEGLVCAIERSP